MKIVIAPDSFKGALSASEAACAIAKGVRRVFPKAEIIKVPLADGGEGTVEALVEGTGGKIQKIAVKGPLGKKTEAHYGILGTGETAVIEMAQASGLTLLSPHERDPSRTSTYGTGELIKAALGKGCRKLIIGIGGSATVDGGAGMAQALGAKLLNNQGEDIGPGGGELKNLTRIDISGLDSRITDTQITVASDVNNPLCGEKGAARVYGPQKGATPKMVEELEKALGHFAQILKRDLRQDVAHLPGAGAAGGLGAGLMAFLGARLQSGINIVMEAMELEKQLLDADLVITGEGKMDKQTIYGKAPAGVARLAGKHQKPLIGICGMLGEGAEILMRHGFSEIFPQKKGNLSLEEAMKKSFELTARAAEEAMETWKKKIKTHI